VRIAAFPRGFLDLVEASREGRGLSLCSDELSPVVDLFDMYGANSQVVRTAQNNLGAGANPFFTVPTGKMWRVIAGSINCQTGATSTANAVGVYVAPPNDLTTQVHLVPGFNIAVSSVVVQPIQALGPIVLIAGTVIGVYAGAVAVTPIANLSFIVQEFNQ